jgi:hypothetical protein
VAVRRSERNKHDKGKIQDKAEALKKKNNDITGNTPAFAILNSVDPNLLEKIALSSSIKLGDAPEKTNASISTIQAKELAKVTLMATKKRLEEQAKQKDLEGGSKAGELVNAEWQTGPEEVPSHRPPKKPPKKRGKSKVREDEAADCSRV